jgi:hypothetical protein
MAMPFTGGNAVAGVTETDGQDDGNGQEEVWNRWPGLGAGGRTDGWRCVRGGNDTDSGR